MLTASLSQNSSSPPYIGNYAAVQDSGSDATLYFNPAGQSAGLGTALATLRGVGSNVTLGTLINDGALKVA